MKNDEKCEATVISWLGLELGRKLTVEAENLGLTRSKLARNLIEVGLNDLGVMRKVGVVSSVKGYRRAKKRLVVAMEGVVRILGEIDHLEA